MSPEFLPKVLIALTPVLILVVVLHRLDSHRLLGTRFMVLTFLAGCVIAVASAVINALMLDGLGIDFTYYTRYPAPLIEESLKAAFVVYLFRTNRIGYLIDAGIIGFTIGAGFAFAENGFYLNHASDAHHGVWLVRGFGTAIMHGGATALFAIVAEVMTERHRRMNTLLYMPGLVLAFLLHSVFNHFPVSPILATVATLLIIPTILFLLFERNEASIHQFLKADFEAHRRLLNQIRHGEFSGCEAGRFLHDMKEKLSAPVAREMIEYFCLHTELVLDAERILLAREQAVTVEVGSDIREKLVRMHELEDHIGRAALLTLRQHLDFTARDMWDIHLLERDAERHRRP
jgi:RsiW-degrading membrane proteinase PrsW (M82 family)